MGCVGLIVSGGQDTIIEVREPDSKDTDDAKYLLLGHTHNVCALDNYAGIIISGSWDGCVVLASRLLGFGLIVI